MSTKLKYPITLTLAIIFITATGQGSIRKMEIPLNHPSLNYWSPFISLDGNNLIFQCDNTENRQPGLFFTSRSGANWKDPVLLPKSINNSTVFLDGTTLSGDGKEIWVSAQRSGGIGGYDLISFQIKPDGFAEGKNIGAPLNSNQHEASAVFTPDGGTVYFMRCVSIQNGQANGCKILISKKKLNGTWEAPVELPGEINKGNSQFPRILADGETLLFFSDSHRPNAGGMDIYLSTWDGTSWSTPIALTFLNSEKSERPVSITSFGRSVLTARRGEKKSELVEVFFPAELKPRQVLRINGNIVSADPATIYLSLYDSATGKQLRSLRPDATGSFMLFLPYGNTYRLFADPAADNLPFYSTVYNLSKGQGQVAGRLTIDPGVIQSGFKIDLGAILFLENTAPTPGSVPMINRVIRLMQSNPGSSFQVICDNQDIYEIFFGHLRKKGVKNEMEFLMSEFPTGNISLLIK